MYVTNRPYPKLAMDEVTEVLDGADHGQLEPINFNKGVSSFNPFDHVHTQLTGSRLGEHVTYGEINGLDRLRRLICRHYQEKFDYDLNPKRVCITDGASGALTIAMAILLKTGGEMVLPQSCYPIYNVMAKIFKARCRPASMRDGSHLDLERLPKQISRRTKAIIINSPSNPHGVYLRAAELEAIADLGVPVIFDEVYQSLPLVDETIPSAIHYSDRHMIVSSLSKSLAIAGFRVGYLIVPESFVQAVTNVKAVLNMCTSLPSQILAEHLLHHWDDLLEKHCAILRHNWWLFDQTARRLGLRLRSDPKAGFFGLVDVAGSGSDARQISLDLARNHALGATPGIDFQDSDHAFLRLNFACPTHQIEAGLMRLAVYLERLRNRPAFSRPVLPTHLVRIRRRAVSFPT